MPYLLVASENISSHNGQQEHLINPSVSAHPWLRCKCTWMIHFALATNFMCIGTNKAVTLVTRQFAQFVHEVGGPAPSKIYVSTYVYQHFGFQGSSAQPSVCWKTKAKIIYTDTPRLWFPLNPIHCITSLLKFPISKVPNVEVARPRLSLPDLSGIQVCEYIKKPPSHVLPAGSGGPVQKIHVYSGIMPMLQEQGFFSVQSFSNSPSRIFLPRPTDLVDMVARTECTDTNRMR